jgi:hypothetical protein
MPLKLQDYSLKEITRDRLPELMRRPTKIIKMFLDPNDQAFESCQVLAKETVKC